MKTIYNKLKEISLRRERHILSLALVLGFILDIYTFNRVDLLFDNLIIVFYLIISALGIFIINLKPKYSDGLYSKINNISPIAVQFALGGLFSGFFVIYSRSSSISASWPFLIIILVLLIGNEFFREKYQKFYFQVAIWYTSLYLYLIFLLPVILNKISKEIFVLSGLTSLIIVISFIWVIIKFTSPKIDSEKNTLTILVVSILLIINLFYFLNIIPPIPLSLKDAGVYHSLELDNNNNFIMLGEEKTLWEKISFSQKIELIVGEKLYFFSTVFAPTDLKTDIVHQWQYYDNDAEKWTDSSKIAFSIIGGRENGYRGYSYKENLFPGGWRVIVKIPQGQVVGKVNFEIVATDKRGIYIKEIK